MKFCKLGLLFALLAAISLPAAAQELHVNVPFNFAAGGKTLPAGQYTIQRTFADGDAWSVIGDHDSAIVLISTVQSASEPHNPSLVFLQQGGLYSLTRIWASEFLGRDVLRSNVKQTVVAKGDTNYVEVRAE
jgi:hypothetical protein